MTTDAKVRSAMCWMIERMRETMAFVDGELPGEGDANGIQWTTFGDGIQISARPSWADMDEDE